MRFFLTSIFLFIYISNYGQIFQQNFNSTTTLSDYFNSSPGINQFRNIGTTNVNSTVSVSSNSLVFSKVVDATTNAYAERNVDFSSIPTAIKMTFTISFSGGTTGTSIFLLAIGSNVENNATPPTISNIFARLAFNTTNNSGEFVIRDITNTTNGTNTYSGTQTITWILNHTGTNLNYNSPNSSIESIADGKADVWVGSNKEFDDISVQTNTQSLSRFKFYTNGWSNGTIITLDDIVIENESVLPVQLTSFTASLNDNKVKLNWSTATEVNNYGFEIERNIVGTKLALSEKGWEKIGFVHGHGNCNSPKDYTFVDVNPPNGKVQYKLKQIDFDGTFECSSIVEVDIDTPQNFILKQNYPNPFNPTTTIKYTLPAVTLRQAQSDNKQNVMVSQPERQAGQSKGDNLVTLKVYDVLGNEIATLVNEIQSAGNYEVNFDASKLSSGIYIYKLQTGKFLQTRKMLLVK